MWHGTTSNANQQYTQSNQTKPAESRAFFGYGATGKALKNFITILPEGTTVKNWQEKFSEVTKANHPDRVNVLIVSKKISPEEGNARKAYYTNVISAYNAWKQEKLKAAE